MKSQRKTVNKITNKALKTAVFTAFSLLFASLLFPLQACEKHVPETRTSFALDTVVSVTIYRSSDRDAAEEAIELCRSFEKTFSRTDPESELYKLNHSDGKKTAVSEPLYRVLHYAIELMKSYPGYFDVTLGSVSALYGFGTNSERVPSESELLETLSHTGLSKVALSDCDQSVTISDPLLVIDLGAVAKGYIADRMAELLRKKGVGSAIIDLGGNIYTVGNKPDGSPYTVGIRDPKDGSRLSTRVSGSDVSVVTSGNYERCFTSDGVLYHHILDPMTGAPVRNGLSSVTVISESSMEADALSTLFFVAGEKEIPELCYEIPGVKAVIIRDDGSVYSYGFTDR